MKRSIMGTLFFLTSAIGAFGTARADEPKPSKPHGSLAELHADYLARERELDRSRIRDLAAFAKAHPGDEAELAYDELFGLAMAKNLYQDAAPFADARAADPEAPISARAHALLVAVIAKADAGRHEESLRQLAGFMQANAAEVADPNRPKLPESTVITLGEAYLERLLASRRYDLAAKLRALVVERAGRPGVQAHFKERLARLDLLGKAAPDIVGNDVDGKPVKLSDLKGKVVLVEFWAAWCPPCLESIPMLSSLQSKYGKDGFVILGVNLDAQRDEIGTIEKARPIVRRLLVSAGISWPNVLAGPGGDDPAKAYGVTDIPDNFLVGRDGSVVAFELMGAGLDKAVAEEVGKK